MSDFQEILRSVVRSGDQDGVTHWLKRYLAGSPNEPMLFAPPDYPSPGTFLIELLFAFREDDLSSGFGDASATLFLSSVADGSFAQTAKASPGAAQDILNLVEALPCSPGLMEKVVDALIWLLASHLYRGLPGHDINLRRAILLATASKIRGIAYVKPDLAFLLNSDLRDEQYAAAAYSIMVRLSPDHAARRLQEVIATLLKSNLPTSHVMFDLAQNLGNQQEDPTPVLAAVACLGNNRIKQEFAGHLKYLGDDDLLQILQDMQEPPAEVAPMDRVESHMAARWGRLDDVCKEKATALLIQNLRHCLNRRRTSKRGQNGRS